MCPLLHFGSWKNTSGRAAVETLVGTIILLALALLALAIYVKQSHYDEERFDMSLVQMGEAAALPSTEKELGIRLVSLVPPEFQPLSEPEVFDEATLSDKINGKAELYLQAGFVELKAQRFAHSSDADAWFEVFVYDMGKPRNAFCVHSTQRRSDATATELARFAYSTQNALFLVQGKYYLELVAAQTSSALSQAMQEMASSFIQTYPQPAVELPELDLLPAEKLLANTSKLYLTDVFSFSKLDNVLTAGYSFSGAELTAFVSLRDSPEEATELGEDYYAFLLSLGGEALAPQTTEIPKLKMVDLIGDYELLFSQGRVFAGVHAASDKSLAEQLALTLYEKLVTQNP